LSLGILFWTLFVIIGASASGGGNRPAQAMIATVMKLAEFDDD
jgi:hypothetical protein